MIFFKCSFWQSKISSSYKSMNMFLYLLLEIVFTQKFNNNDVNITGTTIRFMHFEYSCFLSILPVFLYVTINKLKEIKQIHTNHLSSAINYHLLCSNVLYFYFKIWCTFDFIFKPRHNRCNASAETDTKTCRFLHKNTKEKLTAHQCLQY